MKQTMNAGACTSVGPVSDKHHGINPHANNPLRSLLVMGMAAAFALPVQAAPLITDGLRGYWSFDTDTGATVADTSGVAGGPHNGNMVGTPSYSTTDLPPGLTGQSADMRTANTGVVVSTDSGNNTFFDMGSTYSVSYWTKNFPTTNMWRSWVQKDGDGPGGFRIIATQNGSPTKMGVGMLPPGAACWHTTTNIYSTGTPWRHYVITYGGGSCKIYQDGIQIASQSISGAMNATKGALTFGCASNQTGGVEGAPKEFSRIQLDEVYIFNRALTAAEVGTLYGASTWDGGTGNWADSKWNGGQAPVTGRNMMISAASADSNVTLDADFSAQSLILGSTATSALTINNTKTLTLAEATVGASGTLQVDGTLTANSFDNRGSSTFSAGSALTFSGSASLLSLTGGTLTYDSTTPATPAMMRFYGGGLAGSGEVNATTKYEVWANTTVNLNLGGATTALDVIANFTATLNGTNTYGGQTYVRGGARLNFVPGVGLPSGSNLKIEDNATAAWSGDLIRPSGTGPGQMQVSARHAHSAYGGPARLGFGTKVGEVITLENLVWNDGFFQHSEGWYIQRSNATDPIEIMNPIDLATGGGTKPRAVFIQSGTQPVTFSGVLSGVGGALRLSSDWDTSSTATMILTAKNTYTGNTEVQRGKLILTAGAQLTFVTGATTGVNNTLTGPGYATLDGDFHIDTTLTDATTLTAGEWQLESVPSLGGAYGTTFRVVDSAGNPWTDAGSDTWTKTVGAKLYTFDEAFGKLTLSVASGGGYASWAATNSITGDPFDDFNNDGVANGVAYFMNATGLATNPAINGSTKQVTWPNGGNIPNSEYGADKQFVVQTSSDLQTWTDVPVTEVILTDYSAGPPPSDGSVSYTLTGASPRFVRLKVTPN
jgi:autotransporter-associated beta strand protein